MAARIKVGDEELSKADLCRRVLALDPNAMPADIMKRVLDEYGVKVNSGTASTIRSQFLVGTGKAGVVVGAAQKTKPAVKRPPKKTEPKPAPKNGKTHDINLFIEALKHVKEAVNLLGDKETVVDLAKLL